MLVVPLKQEITKTVNSLTLSSMMQDYYRYCTTHTQWLRHSLTVFTKASLLTVLSAKSKFCRRLSFNKHQDCSAIATARIHSSCVASFSLSATTPADLTVLSGSANLFSHELGQLSFKPVDWLQSQRLASKPVRL